MYLGQYINWDEQSNTINGIDVKSPIIAADSLPGDYIDISSMENWAKFGPGIIGSTTGFRDWKCLQREIKAIAVTIVNNDFVGQWGNFNPDQELIACQYLLSQVPPGKFNTLFPDPGDRLNVAMEFDLNNRRARGNWQKGTGRIEVMRVYLFGKIGKVNALEAMVDAVRDGLFELYEGGVEGTVEDGYPGIVDFILSRSPYESNGLTKRSYPVIDESGDTLDTIAATLVNIASNGMY